MPTAINNASCRAGDHEATANLTFDVRPLVTLRVELRDEGGELHSESADDGRDRTP